MSGQLRAALRLLARGYAAGGAPEPAPAPRRRQAVERAEPSPSRAALVRYLDATAGEALLPAIEEGALPPLFPCTRETASVLELLSRLEPPLPLGALVHAGSELLVARPPRADRPLRCRVELDQAERVPGGVRLQVTARNWEGGGVLCTEAKHRFRLRAGPAPERAAAEPPDLAGWARAAGWELDGGAGRRYARASGDWNPIHLSRWTARPLGFRRPILHGFCIAAMAAHALCERHWSGDPTALRRIDVAFRAPLPLPSRAVLWTRERDAHHDFRVTDADGARLYAEGEIGGVLPGRDRT